MRAFLGVFVAVFVSTQAWGQSHLSPLPKFDPNGGGVLKDDNKSLIAPNTLEDIEAVAGTNFYEMAEFVARVETTNGSGFCTGFRVAEDLFMTNHHCWDYAKCGVVFHLGYEKGMQEERQARFKCTEELIQEESLDYALYRVAPVGDIDADLSDNFPIASLSKQDLVMDMPLLVPGHPQAYPKMIDTSEQCRLTRVEPYLWYDRHNIQHQCDTQGGSSGSAVLDRATGFVVGLHWGATGSTDSNHAIPMTMILDHLAENLPDIIGELTIVE